MVTRLRSFIGVRCAKQDAEQHARHDGAHGELEGGFCGTRFGGHGRHALGLVEDALTVQQEPACWRELNAETIMPSHCRPLSESVAANEGSPGQTPKR